jgi:putative nucleotidyltransferase with HDIG domain
MTTALTTDIRERVSRIQTTPAIPMVLQPLLKMLAMPAEDVDVNEVVRLVSYDNTIAAQCLRVAGSPLFGLAQPPKSIAAAVVVLGLRRVESILLTCCMGQAFPSKKSGLDPTIFWKHSLGCAMVCRKFSEKLPRADKEKAYVAGLLHDIGFLVNALVVPTQFAAAVALAAREQMPLDLAETETLGFTHCETGQALAEHWALAPEIAHVIAYHHSVEKCPEPRSLTALVHLSDLMCRMRGLDYGYYERQKVDLLSDPGWKILVEENKELTNVDLELFTFELDDAVNQISELVKTIFGSAAAA